MKKRVKIFCFFVFVALLIIGGICLINLKADIKNIQPNILANTDEMIQQDELINISECSEEFMNDYFEENQKLNEENNKENVLIVTSKEEIKDSFGASNIIEAPNNQYILQYDSEEAKQQAFEALNKSNDAVIVEENVVRTVAEYNSWGIEKTDLDYAIEIAETKGLNEVTVAIIDTGCDMVLFNQYYPGRIVETYNVLDPDGEMVDTDGHGTHIAGTIAEGTPDNVKILPIKASIDGRFYTTDLIAAINYVSYYDKADVINMSYGGYGYTDSEYQAIETAKQENIICVTAAGNDNVSTKFYPAAYDNTISISSVDSELNKSYFSNYGSTISFAAPGSDILSINGTKSGTSMATPHAVAAVAILKSYNDDITLDDTIELLKAHVIDLGNVGWDKYYGHGMISFANAQFCDGENCTKGDCDEFGIFKIEPEEVVTVEKIEIPMPIITSYNYGTIYNLLSMEMKIYYFDGTYETKALWEIDDLEINGYDPYSIEEQTIEVKYGELSTTFTLTHPETYELGWEYTILDENIIELTLYKDNRKDIGKLYVPETIDGYNVVSLAGAPDSSNVAQIFYNSQDAYAFEEIILPKTLTKIGKAVFMSSGIKKVTSLADSVAIGAYAFYESGIETFDGTISELGQSCFSGCSVLDHITLIDTMEVIPTNAFTLCYELEHINFPSSLTSIELNAFFYTKINNVTIPEGVTKIGNYAFGSCVDLENITLPESLIEIGEGAFTYTHIKNLVIPKNVSSIGEDIFNNCSSLMSIVVDENNLVYDSRDNCNAIIETDTNTLILGCRNTIIPATVKIIGDGAFYGNLSLSMITIPDGIAQIEANAFFGCDYLRKVIIPRSVTTIGEDAFESCSILWLYTDSYAKTYATQKEIPYEALDISYISVELSKDEYKAFEVIYGDDISIKLYYDRAVTVDDTYTEYTGIHGREEIIDTEYAYASPITPPGYIIAYGPKDEYGYYRSYDLRYGDTYFTILGIDERGEEFEKQVDITVVKDTPVYTIPTGLKAEAGTKLSEITLPDGFEWMDDTQVVTGEGNEVYYVRFVPEDTNNYEIIENIEVIVNETSNVMTDFAMCGLKTEYRAFETLDIDNLYAMITYDDGHIEYVYDDITISYQQEGEDCFKYGDTLFHVRVVTKKGMVIARSVYVTVLKAIPEYTIPTNLEATRWQTLSEIILPEGFAWMNETEILKETGNISYKAIYIPEDTENYEIVQNIDININVKHVELPFEDVYESDWFYPAIEFVYGKGYIVGTSPTTFEPRTKLTRGMIVTILFRIEGANKVSDTMEFPDVLETEYYYEAVRWAKANQVVNGYQDGYFRPDNYITREELACILMNYSKFKNENIELATDLSVFNDGDTVSAFAQSAMEWAVARGTITGYDDDNTLRPQGTTTRDVAAVMICKYFTNNNNN